MSKFNFICTTDVDTRNLLEDQGFQLISDDNGRFTFLNDSTIRFSKDVSPKKVSYTNILNI